MELTQVQYGNWHTSCYRISRRAKIALFDKSADAVRNMNQVLADMKLVIRPGINR